MLFEKTWGEPVDVGVWYADELPNGDYFLIGGTRAFYGAPTQNYACRLNAHGDILWQTEWGNQYEQDGVAKVLALKDGTYMAVGSGLSGLGGGINDVTLTNISPDGEIIFNKYFNFGYEDAGTDIFETADGSFVISGVGGGLGIYYPLYLKVDRMGNEIWRRSQVSLPDCGQFFISECPDNGFISVGITDGYRNSYIAKHDSLGYMQWVKYPFGQGDSVGNRAQGLHVNTDGTFVVNYGVSYPAGSGHESIRSSCSTYSPDGAPLSQVNYAVQLLHMQYSSSDSSFYGIKDGSELYRIDDGMVLSKKVGITVTVPGEKALLYFAPTSDGGYVGVGQYHPNDNVPRNFYFIKFSKDGRYQVNSFLETVTAYPNPSRDGKVMLSFESETEETVGISIFTMEGQQVHAEQVLCPANSHTEVPVQLDLATSSCGIYILEVRTSGEYRRMKLVITNK